VYSFPLLNKPQTPYFDKVSFPDFYFVKKTFSVLPVIIIIIFIQSCERPTESTGDPGIPPAVPTGLIIFYASDGEITIDWRNNSEPDVKGYNVYRRTASTELVNIGFTQSSFFFDDSLYYDTTYYYRVSAVSIWNRESDLSDEVSAAPINRFSPRRPLWVQINARNWEGEKSVFLNWWRNEESDVAGYNIYRSTNPSFISDSSSFIGFTSSINFADTFQLSLYTNYYYKIKAVDKGGLLSEDSETKQDFILDIPEIIFPQDNSEVNFFTDFLILALDIPAAYRITVQTNPFFDEIWNSTIETNVINDTLKIRFNPPYLETGRIYYWRVSTYSGNSQDPNSISGLFSFILKN
jgi:hypothetical protein